MFWFLISSVAFAFSVTVSLVLLSSGRSTLIGMLCVLGGALASVFASRMSDEWLRHGWYQVAIAGAIAAGTGFLLVRFSKLGRCQTASTTTTLSQSVAFICAGLAVLFLMVVATSGPKPLNWVALGGLLAGAIAFLYRMMQLSRKSDV